jgi:hypothetical protein
MSGSDTVPAGGIPAGVYGTLGTAAASNVPGGRSASTGWIDGGGNLWLFGGVGDDSLVDPNDPGNAYGGLNDLWEFNPVTKEWTWVSGSDTLNANGTYGTEGIAATGNVPEADSIQPVGLTVAATSGFLEEGATIQLERTAF